MTDANVEGQDDETRSLPEILVELRNIMSDPNQCQQRPRQALPVIVEALEAINRCPHSERPIRIELPEDVS